MKKKIWLGIAITVTLVFAFIANAFTGNPLSKTIAKQNTEQFLQKTYSEETFHIEKGWYNFKTGTYDFTVTGDQLPQEVQMMRAGFFGQQSHYDGVRDSRMDTSLNRRLNEQASAYLVEAFRSGAPHIRGVDMEFSVMRGELPTHTDWSPTLSFVEEPWLMIMMDATNVSVEQFEEEVQFMQQTLEDLGIQYRSASVNAQLWDEDTYELNRQEAETNPEIDIDRDDFWYLRYFASFHPKTKKIETEVYDQ